MEWEIWRISVNDTNDDLRVPCCEPRRYSGISGPLDFVRFINIISGSHEGHHNALFPIRRLIRVHHSFMSGIRVNPWQDTDTELLLEMHSPEFATITIVKHPLTIMNLGDGWRQSIFRWLLVVSLTKHPTRGSTVFGIDHMTELGESRSPTLLLIPWHRSFLYGVGMNHWWNATYSQQLIMDDRRRETCNAKSALIHSASSFYEPSPNQLIKQNGGVNLIYNPYEDSLLNTLSFFTVSHVWPSFHCKLVKVRTSICQARTKCSLTNAVVNPSPGLFDCVFHEWQFSMHNTKIVRT